MSRFTTSLQLTQLKSIYQQKPHTDKIVNFRLRRGDLVNTGCEVAKTVPVSFSKPQEPHGDSYVPQDLLLMTTIIISPNGSKAHITGDKTV